MPLTRSEVETPLVPVGGALVKDEGSLPTGTFKARGAAVGVAAARWLGASGVALPSAGNAGAAWAAYASSAALPCAVWTSADAPCVAIEAARAHGATVEVVEGTITDAGARAAASAGERGWHLAATFREPWRVEGKKTALFEIARALRWRLPDAAVLPVGGGVGVVAWHKAAEELRASGWATGATRLYAVQAAGCAPIVRAFKAGADSTMVWEEPRTGAPGIRIPSPLAGGLVLRALRESGGGAIAVTDDEMRRGQEQLFACGLEVCLEAGAAWAGYERLRSAGAFDTAETVVVYATGNRLAD
jgi:threonine synthase